MVNRLGINIVIEKEGKEFDTTFIASSPDINVFAEGKNIDEAKRKFIEGVKNHFETFPEDKKALIIEEDEKFEMPMIQRIFL